MTISQATKRILMNDPFYGFVLMSLSKRMDEKSRERACVHLNGLNYEIVVNPAFWNKCTDEQQVEVLKHELLHICFFHLLHMDEYKDKRLMNIACDAEVNQYLNVSLLETTEDGAINILKMFPGIKTKAGTRYYYDYLMQQSNQGGTQRSGGSGSSNSNNGDDGSGGGSGNDSESGNQNGNSNQSDGLDKAVSNHSSWEESEKLSDVEKQLVKSQMDYILVNAYEASQDKNCGDVPGGLVEYIKNLMKPKPPVFNWQAYIRRLIGTSVEYFVKNTRKRPSRRFEDAMGHKHKYKASILVGVDTSGSVDSRDLADFFTEIHHVYRSGVCVDVAECDTQIHNIVPYKGHFDGKVHGRGGTSFDPVINHFNENRRKYSALVYFTDGYCHTSLKVMGPSIWVISRGGARKQYPGKAVYVEGQ